MHRPVCARPETRVRAARASLLGRLGPTTLLKLAVSLPVYLGDLPDTHLSLHDAGTAPIVRASGDLSELR